MANKDESLELFRVAVWKAMFDVAYNIQDRNEITLYKWHSDGAIVAMLESHLAGSYDGPYDIIPSPMEDGFLIKSRDPLLPWVVNVNIDTGDSDEIDE